MASYACSIEQLMQGRSVVNVVGFARTDTLGAETAAEAAIVAEQVALSWKQNIIPRQSNVIRFLQVSARGVLESGFLGVSTSSPVDGSQSFASLPSFAAVRAQFLTATPGRAGRGRTGFSGVPEQDSDVAAPNSLLAGALTAWSNSFAVFISQLAAASPTIFPVVISRQVGLVPRPAPLVSPVTSSNILSSLGTRVSRIR